MSIGKHDPKNAKGTTFKSAIAIGLDEAFTALEESITGLTDEQIWAFPLSNRHNIVTLFEHCLECLDLYGCEVQGTGQVLRHEERFDAWRFSPEQVRPKMAGLPGIADVQARMKTLREAVTGRLESASESDLLKPRDFQSWFWTEFGKTSADAYIRAIAHTMTHVRQIWFLRGMLGLTDHQGWPQQHWA